MESRALGQSLDKNRRGIAAMLVAAAAFSLMDTGVKLLSAHYPALQVAALRSLSSLPLIVAYVAWRGAFGRIFHVRWPLHLLRGVLGIVTLAMFTVGVRRLPLAEAYSIAFVAPMLITALSAVLLKERVEPARWIAVAVGLVGVLVVLRPTGEGVMTVAGLAVLASAAGYALSAVLLRVLGRTDSGESLVFWLMVTMSIGASALALPSWVPVRIDHGWILAGIATSGFVAQIALTEAFRESEASVVAPFEYTALAWGVTLDWILWRALPDRFTFVGAAIIIASGIYLVRRERVHIEAERP